MKQSILKYFTYICSCLLGLQTDFPRNGVFIDSFTQIMLKKIRIAVSILLFAWITFYFIDFAGILPQNLHFIADIQFVPALLAVHVWILAALVLLTLILGRVYCSSICPLGILQDIISWFSKKMNKRKKFHFVSEKKILRWTIFSITVIGFLFGFTFLVALLDPYGAYGRIATHLFRPAYLQGNNWLDRLFSSFDNYTFKQVKIYSFGALSFIVALITFVAIGILSWRNGRTYCNTICPVGTILGFLSRFSMFKPTFVSEKCNSCGLCSMKCKASCIDSKNTKIDYSRCVSCFNCIEVCNRNAMKYKFTPVRKNKSTEHEISYLSKTDKPTIDVSKRRFLQTTLLTGVAASNLFAQNILPKRTLQRKMPVAPPGAIDLDSFNQKCISCHLCVSKCPSQIIRPALLEYGLGGMMQPKLSFDNGFCNFDCVICSDMCPTDALIPISKEKKQRTQIGVVHFVIENCIVNYDNRKCGACAELCPTKAVRMVPYKNSLTIPEIEPQICIGCGACEYVCPAIPHKAIYVEGVEKQNLINT